MTWPSRALLRIASYRGRACGCQNPLPVDPTKWLEGLTARFRGIARITYEFLEHVKLECITDQVFCFTPKGDLIQLPKGATPIRLRPNSKLHYLASGIAASGQGGRCCAAALDAAQERADRSRSSNLRGTDAAGERGSTFAVTGRAKAAIRRMLPRGRPASATFKLGREPGRSRRLRAGRQEGDGTRRSTPPHARSGLKDGDEMLPHRLGPSLSARSVVARLYPELAGRKPKRPMSEAVRAVIGLPPARRARPGARKMLVSRFRANGSSASPTRGRGPVAACHRLPRARRLRRPAGTLDRPATGPRGAHAPVHKRDHRCDHLEPARGAGTYLHIDRRAERQYL